MRHFTLTEIAGDNDIANIGTITNVRNVEDFTTRFKAAVCDHFDINSIDHVDIPDIFDDFKFNWDVTVNNDIPLTIQISVTWLY